VAVIIGDEVTAGTKGMLAYSALGFLNCYHMLLCLCDCDMDISNTFHLLNKI
jgi:hypothetical protein